MPDVKAQLTRCPVFGSQKRARRTGHPGGNAGTAGIRVRGALAAGFPQIPARPVPLPARPRALAGGHVQILSAADQDEEAAGVSTHTPRRQGGRLRRSAGPRGPRSDRRRERPNTPHSSRKMTGTFTGIMNVSWLAVVAQHGLRSVVPVPAPHHWILAGYPAVRRRHLRLHHRTHQPRGPRIQPRHPRLHQPRPRPQPRRPARPQPLRLRRRQPRHQLRPHRAVLPDLVPAKRQPQRQRESDSPAGSTGITQARRP